MKQIKVLTWNIHGNYLYYLSHANLGLFVPVKQGIENGYTKLAEGFKWGSNVHQIKAHQVKDYKFDCVLFQNTKNYQIDQFGILSDSQRSLPKIYLEHEPPRENPTDDFHFITDPKILVIHVTQFNRLMWRNKNCLTKVIEHGISLPDKVSYQGNLAKGIVVINNLAIRGRRLGLDIFKQVAKRIPLDLVGIGSDRLGGLGEVPYERLIKLIPKYRFFFNPIRYTSLGLAVCEAMMTGTPVTAIATTEMATVIQNGKNGFIDTNIEILIKKMELLLKNKALAEKLGSEAKSYAQKRFSINRFTKEWEEVISTWSAR